MNRVWLCLAMLAWVAGAQAGPAVGYKLLSNEHKIVSGPDGDGDLEVSFRVTVENTGTTGVAALIIAQGIDTADFPIYDAYLETTLSPGETRTIRDLSYIPLKTYGKITRWEWLLEFR